ncbi:hypothetical protein A0H81_03632 [Grifola frondosa]|uniref:Uncharacterized protein n=1 Tax=Grifola frondosa TaxID=5627 RepID=A0A1C7MJB7_GRIFR|nr:hypothetical protein A0H81_03632 [Grifola frondosa]
MNVDKDLDVGAEEGPVEPEEVVVHSGLTSPVLRGQQVPTAPLVDIDQNVDKPPSLSDIEPEPTSPPPTPPAAIVEEHVGDQLPPANETLISPIEQAQTHDRVVKMKRRDERRRSVPQQPQSHAPFTPLRGFGYRGRGGYVGGRGRSGLGRAGFLSSSTGLRHPPEPETQAVAEPNVNLSSTDENALLWEELFGPESPRRPSKRTTNPHPLVFQDTDINCGAQTDKRSRIRKRQLENVVLPPPKKRQWSAAEGVAREWAVAIDTYLDTKRTGRLRPAHDPTSRKLWKNFADAVEEVSCNRQNLSLEIVKNSGLRDSIKVTIDRINDDWGVAAMQRRLKAKEVLDCWRKRFT